jgi:hypothetical protein
MKYQLSLIAIIHLLITTSTSNAMELTCIPKIRKAHYLTDDCIIVSSDSGCHFVNPTTNTIIKQLPAKQNPRITIHPHKTTFALWDAHNVHIYDPKTEKLKLQAQSQQPIHTVLLPPLDDAFLIHYTDHNNSFVTRHPYSDIKKRDTFLYRYDEQDTLTIAFNPIRQQIAVSSLWRFDLFDPTDLNTPITVSHIDLQELEDCPFCEYNPNGSLLALGRTLPDNELSFFIGILEFNTTTNSYIEQDIENTGSLIHIKFHPNSSVLATLGTTGVNSDLMLDYWDVHTCQRIGASLPLNYQFDNTRPLKSFMLSFSPNGKKLLVRIPGKCVVMDVPFEAIHKPDTNKNVTLIYWLLNNYKRTHHNEIPDDIIQLLMHNLLEFHKR